MGIASTLLNHQHVVGDPGWTFCERAKGFAERSVVSLVGKMPARASNVLALLYFFASFAQVSFNVTVRFQICFSRVESGSSAK
jgi:hypothetical protein